MRYNLLVDISNIIQEGLSRSMEPWAEEKKCVFVSVSLPQSYNGFRVSWKQCLNLGSRRWMRPSSNLVRSLIPYGLWTLKTLFAQCQIKFSRCFLKNWKSSWVCNFAIKIVPFRYSRRKIWIVEIIVLHELQEYCCYVWFHELCSS